MEIKSSHSMKREVMMKYFTLHSIKTHSFNNC